VARSPSLTRLENPAPQPPYPFLLVWPVHLVPGGTVENPGSGPQVRSPKCPNLSLSSAFASASNQRLTCHVQHPFQGRASGPVPASYPPAIGRSSRCCDLRFPAAFRDAGISLLGPLSRQTGFRPHCCPAYAGTTHTRACAADPGRVCTFRTYETRTGLGALSTPGTAVFAGHRLVVAAVLPPSIGRSLFTPEPQPNPGCGLVEASARVSVVAPCRPFPCLWPHGRVGGPWAFPQASPPTDQEPATHVTGDSRTQTCRLRLRHTSTSSNELTHYGATSCRTKGGPTATVVVVRAVRSGDRVRAGAGLLSREIP